MIEEIFRRGRCVVIFAVVILALTFISASPNALAQDVEGASPTILLTGTSRGISLEFVRQ